ncbi:MAG TPA: phosphoribosyltransferase family protein [Chitinophagaceae bacterium]
MLKTLNHLTRDLLHLFFPHFCHGCGSGLVDEGQLLCLQCHARLPETNFFSLAGNPVEKTFYGRMPVEAAGATYFFTRDSLVQHLVKELKYHGDKDIGYYLGRLTGVALKNSARFDTIDCIQPLPLNWRREEKRGYNQAALIAAGIAGELRLPMHTNAVIRKLATATQTKKDRIARWQTMREVFEIAEPEPLKDRHVLLVDDIITTGATLEACGSVMLKVPGLRLSIATVAWTI